ncbi:MAG TPA: hypothetical protein VIK53_11060 [Verrucomicrobiae bacterium]
MTHYQFIILQCVYVVAVLSGVAASKFAALPPHVVAAKPNRTELLKQKSKAYLGVFLILNTLVVVAGVVGFVGMLFLWPASPWIFAGGIAGKLIFFPAFTWKVKSGLEDRLAELELFLDGVFVAFIFFGPARHLFFQV